MASNRVLGARIDGTYIDSKQDPTSLYVVYRNLFLQEGGSCEAIRSSLELVRGLAGAHEGDFSGKPFRDEDIIYHIRLFQKRPTQGTYVRDVSPFATVNMLFPAADILRTGDLSTRPSVWADTTVEDIVRPAVYRITAQMLCLQ